MSELTAAILATRGGEYRVRLVEDYYQKTWRSDGAWGSWNLASTFDASAVYGSLAEAQDAMRALRQEHYPSATYRHGYHIIATSKPFSDIRNDGLAWARLLAESNRQSEDDLLAA